MSGYVSHHGHKICSHTESKIYDKCINIKWIGHFEPSRVWGGQDLKNAKMEILDFGVKNIRVNRYQPPRT